MATANISYLHANMNSALIHEMSTGDCIAAFESCIAKLKTRGNEAPFEWTELSRIGYYACSVSQHAHLLLCGERRRSQRQCKFVASLFGTFVSEAESIIAREAPPESYRSFTVCVQHIRERRSDLLNLAQRIATRDKTLGLAEIEGADFEDSNG